LLTLSQSNAPFSAEARDARVSKEYAAGLRRLIKRRHAIASVSPYLVAVVGFAQEWLYENGTLCYFRGSQLRILDLHRSARDEIVVDLRTLLDGTLDVFRTRQKLKRKLLYYSHNIVSCLYSQTSRGQVGCRSWLVVFNALEGRIITLHELAFTSKLFVRNDDRFLYYGTTIGPDDDSADLWTITGFDLTARTWLDRPLNVPHMIGTDIGSTVCFEIIDGYFYGLSNQRSLDVEEVDWLSYYSCFRFPLERRGLARVEEPLDRQLWRRDHTDGPIDDRWTFLRLFKDETTGQLKVVESRKEWLLACITPRRTYYTTEISFDKAVKVDESPSDIPAVKTQQGEVSRGQPRDPHMVHPGDDTSTMSVTLTKCPIRSYYSACQTFIDLVDDSTSFDPRDQRLRLRGGTRSLWAPGERRPQPPRPPATGGEEQDHETLLRQIDDLYKSETGLFWPPEQDPSAAADGGGALADLYQVLNPPGYVGSPQGSWDERSMVYATGGNNGTVGGLKALVFVSWDPSIYLAGTAAYPGDFLASSTADGSPRTDCLPHRPRQAGDNNADGKDTAGRCPTSQPDATSSSCSGAGHTTRASAVAWRTVEPARYREIARGYHFAR
jgi:hypothetical protein